MNPELLIAVGLLLAVVGTALLWASRPPGAGRRAGTRRPVTSRSGRWSGVLICAAVAGGLITGVQWAVVSQTAPAAVWALVLGLPGFLAGATVVRLFSLVVIVHRRREARVRPGQWNSR